MQDLRYGFRVLLKKPGFTITCLLTLALGIGANTAILSVVSAVLLRPLPYKNPDQLFALWENNLKKGFDRLPVSPGDFKDFRDQNTVFQNMAAFRRADVTLTGSGEPERISAAKVSASLFQLLGIDPIAGRSFLPEDDKFGNNHVVIVSPALWQRKLNADLGLGGQTLTLNNQTYTVVGVMPPDFKFLRGVEAWIPFGMSEGEMANRDLGSLGVLVRLKQGVTPQEARTEMEMIAGRIAQQYPATNLDHGVKLITLHEQTVGDIGPSLLILLAAVGLVLLIACANVTNLQFIRAVGRQREMAIRAALGATRLRIIRQLLIESMLLSLVGGFLGVLLALWSSQFLIANLPDNIPQVNDIRIDSQVLLFTLAISVLTGIILGLVPAIRVCRLDLNNALKEGVRGSTDGLNQARLRSLLVISEIALALMLLVGTGLMIKSFLLLQKVNPGFTAENVLSMRLSLSPLTHPEARQQAAFCQQVLKRVESLSAVESAGVTTGLPLTVENDIVTAFSIEDNPATDPGGQPTANYRAVSGDYFKAMKIPLLGGRYFEDRDFDTAPGVAIINETMARRFWLNESPLGKRISIPVPPRPISVEIVGVVGDVKHSGLRGDAKAEIYVHYLQNPLPFVNLVARTRTNPSSLASAVRNEIYAVDKDQPVYDVNSMQEIVAESVSEPRLYMLLLTIFACAALILATVGVYGLMSYSVSNRSYELGIRLALGAQQRDIIKLVLREGIVLGLLGVAIGLMGAFALTRLMSSLLFGVSPIDTVIFISLPVLLILVVLLAGFIPAYRAAKIDPMSAVRYE